MQFDPTVNPKQKSMHNIAKMQLTAIKLNILDLYN